MNPPYKFQENWKLLTILGIGVLLISLVLILFHSSESFKDFRAYLFWEKNNARVISAHADEMVTSQGNTRVYLTVSYEYNYYNMTYNGFYNGNLKPVIGASNIRNIASKLSPARNDAEALSQSNTLTIYINPSKPHESRAYIGFFQDIFAPLIFNVVISVVGITLLFFARHNFHKNKINQT